jgi:chloramphenicol-sensitive protein RarD
VLALPALAYLGVLLARDESTFGQVSPGHTALLVLAGVITAGPLLLFAGAANRIPLSTIGLLQYLAPILQLGCGVLIFNEPMPPARLAGFGLVWLALAVFTADGLRRVRARSASVSIRPDTEPAASAAR